MFGKLEKIAGGDNNDANKFLFQEELEEDDNMEKLVKMAQALKNDDDEDDDDENHSCGSYSQTSRLSEKNMADFDGESDTEIDPAVFAIKGSHFPEAQFYID